MSELKSVQVGLGPWGQSWLRDILSGQADVDPLAFVDIDRVRLSEIRARQDVPASRCFTSLDDALSLPGVNAVLVTTAAGTQVPS